AARRGRAEGSAQGGRQRHAGHREGVARAGQALRPLRERLTYASEAPLPCCNGASVSCMLEATYYREEAEMVQEVIDEATARVVLARARDQLETARENASAALADLRNRIVRLRPTGLVTVNEMAEVIGRDRN